MRWIEAMSANQSGVEQHKLHRVRTEFISESSKSLRLLIYMGRDGI